ncbi:MAG: 6-carboxytetrahydropterin synthase [Calditrichaeota bacterium]|nr:6-carboxytetrahydropterin synthase [Calditrichota bacterium]
MTKRLARVAQTFRWEMGHRIPYHQSGCQNFHGHSYKMIVEVEGEIQDNGMVIDFFDLRDLIQPIVDEMDHAFMCSQDDELARDFLKQSGLKVCFVDFHSTVENIAHYFAQRIRPVLETFPNLHVLRILLYETPEEFAEVSLALRPESGNPDYSG